MVIRQDKDSVEFQKDDAINRNRIFFDFMLRMFNHLTQLYVKEKSLLIDTILKYQSRDDIAKEVEKPNRCNKTRNGNKENTSKPFLKKGSFVSFKKTSRAKSYTFKSNLNAKTGSCSEASSSEEEDIGICKGSRKRDFDNTNKELNGSSIEEDEIKSPKCGRKGNVETVNEETKKSNSEEEEIGIRKCRRKIRIGKINEKVKGWTSSSKQQ